MLLLLAPFEILGAQRSFSEPFLLHLGHSISLSDAENETSLSNLFPQELHL
tara:strand:+ start:869 stop:1021 length:153 start_codon:yes stop_codon:yes gene_type:complete